MEHLCQPQRAQFRGLSPVCAYFFIPQESLMENKALLTAGVLIVGGLLLASALPFVGLPFLLLGMVLLAVSW